METSPSYLEESERKSESKRYSGSQQKNKTVLVSRPKPKDMQVFAQKSSSSKMEAINTIMASVESEF